MADDPKTPLESNPEDDKKFADEFWNTHREKTIGILDEWWAKNKPAAGGNPGDGKLETPPDPGKSRTGGKRTTLKDIIADAVFGPPKE